MNVKKQFPFIHSYYHSHSYLMTMLKNFYQTSFLILLLCSFLLPSSLNSAAVAPKPKPLEPPKVIPKPLEPPPETPKPHRLSKEDKAPKKQALENKPIDSPTNKIGRKYPASQEENKSVPDKIKTESVTTELQGGIIRTDSVSKDIKGNVIETQTILWDPSATRIEEKPLSCSGWDAELSPKDFEAIVWLGIIIIADTYLLDLFSLDEKSRVPSSLDHAWIRPVSDQDWIRPASDEKKWIRPKSDEIWESPSSDGKWSSPLDMEDKNRKHELSSENNAREGEAITDYIATELANQDATPPSIEENNAPQTSEMGSPPAIETETTTEIPQAETAPEVPVEPAQESLVETPPETMAPAEPVVESNDPIQIPIEVPIETPPPAEMPSEPNPEPPPPQTVPETPQDNPGWKPPQDDGSWIPTEDWEK